MYPVFTSDKDGYTVISIPHSLSPRSGIFYSFISFKRKWKQMPRLLRVLVLLIVLIVLVYLIQFLSNLYLKKIDTTLEQTASGKSEEEYAYDSQSYVQPKDEKTPESVIEKLESEDVSSSLKYTSRQQAVIDAMRHAWRGYKKCSWGFDHLHPISCSGDNWFNLGLTIVDALDTLWIMGLKSEFQEAQNWVEKSLNFDQNKNVNLFETTIRVLGGLISAYHLSKQQIFLQKSIVLGNKLMGAFSTSSGIPFSDVNLLTGKGFKPFWGPDSSTSEVATIQLEFRELSRLTGDPKYSNKSEFIVNKIHSASGKLDGLVPIFINTQTGEFRKYSTITLGARADSYYEYLLKQWIQFGKKEESLKQDYIEAIEAIERHLGKYSQPNDYFFLSEISGMSKTVVYKMDELTCYLPGTLALGFKEGLPDRHLEIAKKLLRTCIMTWEKQPTNLAPEITFFNVAKSSVDDIFVKKSDSHYLLRPETVESLWYMYVVTGNASYQDAGWRIFQGIEKYCKVANGYTSIGNVKDPERTMPKDKMESFFLAETLKYLFLLFADRQNQAVDLDRFVFNTEGHLIPTRRD